jgi:hypothetical protein
MYPPRDESDVARCAGDTTGGASYFVWATMLAGGTMSLIAKTTFHLALCKSQPSWPVWHYAYCARGALQRGL